MSKIIISARVTGKDINFLNISYTEFKEHFPTLQFEEYVGIVIHQGLGVIKEESPANT
jgi:hypothetical protein